VIQDIIVIKDTPIVTHTILSNILLLRLTPDAQGIISMDFNATGKLNSTFVIYLRQNKNIMSSALAVSIHQESL
jgi:hypothetical protein